jgi:hypothetical protein
MHMQWSVRLRPCRDIKRRLSSYLATRTPPHSHNDMHLPSRNGGGAGSGGGREPSYLGMFKCVLCGRKEDACENGPCASELCL